jgi:tRNA threonylcarbamoyladenosine biosynthesis protein TsaB
LNLLAVCNASPTLHLAVQNGSTTWLAPAVAGAQASEQALDLLSAGLRALDMPLSCLHAIAFGRGPGAFTGVRNACSLAQGLAFGLSKPVLALCSLMAMAEDMSAHTRLSPCDEVEVAMDARLDAVYHARYRWLGPAQWEVLEAPRLLAVSALSELWRSRQAPPQHVAGNATAVYGPALSVPAQTVCSPVPHQPGLALLRLATRAWMDGGAVAAELAQPLYLREKVALTTAEREALRAGSGVAAQ